MPAAATRLGRTGTAPDGRLAQPLWRSRLSGTERLGT